MPDNQDFYPRVDESLQLAREKQAWDIIREFLSNIVETPDTVAVEAEQKPQQPL